MTLQEYMNNTKDWEITVWDKDYDIETYFYVNENKDNWDKSMDKLAGLLNITEFSKEGVTVNLSEVIEKSIPRLKNSGLFVVCDIDSIMGDIAAILAGNVSEAWFEEFVAVLGESNV